MPVRSLCAAVVVAALAGMLAAAPAPAAPPPNDTFDAPGAFAPYAAPANKPQELTAIGELVEASPDAGVPRCMGGRSFARTIWYRIPELGATQWLNLDAVGSTLGVVDLAAFVQPEVGAATSNVKVPNVCDGINAGGSGSAQEPASALSFLVPPNRPVLIQVGRRGTVSNADAERVFVTFSTIASEFLGNPRGDFADARTPSLRPDENFVTLAGATVTEEDPSVPVCPSLGTVWRKLMPEEGGSRLISVDGEAAVTLATFRGRRPTQDNVLDCVNREGRGAMEMVVPVKRRRPLWVRVGTERTTGDEEAAVTVSDGAGVTVVDGGPGGFDPTRGGPAGGFPQACQLPAAEDGRVGGRKLRGSARAYNAANTVRLRLRIRGDARLCDAQVTLRGPGGDDYAGRRFVSIRPGRRTLRLPRLRRLTQGRYVVRIEALSSEYKAVKVRSKVRGRLSR